MSHFVMGCIVPKNKINEITSFIDENMKQFSEELEVEPYIYKTKYELLEEFGEWKLKNSDSEENKRMTFEEWTIYWFGRPLNEDGSISSTYNQNSKWDWYRIGGRWDGYLTKIAAESEDGGFNFDDKHETIDKNMITVEKHIENVKEDFINHACFGLLTKEGEWLERGDMGWWGTVKDEKTTTDWQEEYIKVLQNQLKDDYIVAVDCHI